MKLTPPKPNQVDNAKPLDHTDLSTQIKSQEKRLLQQIGQIKQMKTILRPFVLPKKLPLAPLPKLHLNNFDQDLKLINNTLHNFDLTTLIGWQTQFQHTANQRIDELAQTKQLEFSHTILSNNYQHVNIDLTTLNGDLINYQKNLVQDLEQLHKTLTLSTQNMSHENLKLLEPIHPSTHHHRTGHFYFTIKIISGVLIMAFLVLIVTVLVQILH